MWNERASYGDDLERGCVSEAAFFDSGNDSYLIIKIEMIEIR